MIFANIRGQTMLKQAISIGLFALSTLANASFCSKTNEYRDGIMNTAKAAAATAGIGAGASGTAAALGVTAVAHSSGATILTGSAGYVAGTIGATAGAVAWAPFVLAGGVAVAGLSGGALYACRSR